MLYLAKCYMHYNCFTAQYFVKQKHSWHWLCDMGMQRSKTHLHSLIRKCFLVPVIDPFETCSSLLSEKTIDYNIHQTTKNSKTLEAVLLHNIHICYI